LVKKNP